MTWGLRNNQTFKIKLGTQNDRNKQTFKLLDHDNIMMSFKEAQKPSSGP